MSATRSRASKWRARRDIESVTIEDQVKDLEGLLDPGLMTQEDYDKKRTELLSEM